MLKSLRTYHVIGWLFAASLLLSCQSKKGVADSQSRTQTTLSEQDRQLFTTVFIDAGKQKVLGNFSEALYLYKKALDIDPNSAATQFEIARIEALSGNYGAALPYAQSAFETEPDNIYYAEFLGQVYAELRQLDKSAEVFTKLLEHHPEAYDYYFTLGNILSAQGKYDEAIKLYDDLENQVGQNEEITLQKQVLYVDMGDYESALQEIEGLIALHPEEVRYKGMKAEILEKSGDLNGAIAIYESILVDDPGNGLVLISLYEIYFGQGEKKKAEDYLARAFSSPDLSIDVKVNILLNYLSDPAYANRDDYIGDLASRLEDAHPRNAKTFAVQGDLYLNQEKYKEARTSFRKAVELDPNRPPIWQQIITLDSQLSDFDAMESESAEAMELFPELPVFYLFHGIALIQKGDVDGAIESLTVGKNLVVDNNAALAQFHASLGDAYHTKGNDKKSDNSYESALKYDPNNVIVLNNYAYYLSLRGENLERAEEMAKKANNIAPNEATFQDTYAWVLYRRANYANALFWIEEALKNGGNTDPVVYEHYGDILIKMSKKEEAIEAWQKAIELGGDKGLLQAKIDQSAP